MRYRVRHGTTVFNGDLMNLKIMAMQDSQLLLDKIFDAMQAGFTKVYQDAYENGTQLVISKKAGEVEHIKVVSINPLKYIKVR